MQIPFGGEQPLHQRCGTTPQDRMTGQDQFMSHCGQGVTFPDAWFPHGDHIDGCLQKGSALEPFQLEFQGWAKMPRLKGQKGLSCVASSNRYASGERFSFAAFKARSVQMAAMPSKFISASRECNSLSRFI